MSEQPSSQRAAAHQLSYASVEPPKNLAAMFSFIFGMLSFIPWIPPALAVWLGRTGIRNAERRGRRRLAKVGMMLGILGLLWSAPATALGYLVWQRAGESSRQVATMSNLRMIGQAMFFYTNDNDLHLPADASQLAAPGYVPGTVFVCPARTYRGLPPVSTETFGRCDYVLLTRQELGARRITDVRNPGGTVIGYAPPSNFGGRGAAFLYADGHVEWHEGAQLQSTVKMLPANPTIATGGSRAARAKFVPLELAFWKLDLAAS